MELVELPILSASTSVRNALGIMNFANRAGIVTTFAGRKTVIEAGDLVGLIDTPLIRIGTISPARSTGTLPRDPLSDYLATEAALDSQQAIFGIFNSDMGYANVITRHEFIAGELRAAPGYYVCTGIRKHMYNDVTVPSDRICNKGDRTNIVQIIVR